MIDDVTYIINTHAKYTLPLEKLLDSMLYIPKDRIILVVAGSGLDKAVDLGNGIRMHMVTHNSFDYTGAIALLDQDIPTADHIFFLQDTMEFGFNTDYLIRQANGYALATAVFGGQCNLVLYRRDYLFNPVVVDFIQQRRNLSKLESVHFEGALWKGLDKGKDHYRDATCEIQGEGTPYSDIPRIKEYYGAIDLIKWKANYGQNMHNMIVTP